jgi:parallel beta-helix repeat protein
MDFKMNFFRVCIFLLFVGSSFVSAESFAFYISQDGNDEWSGRISESLENDGPFATIQRAQQAVRDLIKSGEATSAILVYFRGGEYSLTQEIVFTPQDSGERNGRVVYKNYQNEKVLLTGGKKLNGWRLLQENRWVCDVPEVLSKDWRFQQLFVNGERRFRARTPNDGFYRVKDPMEKEDTPFHEDRFKFGFYPGNLLSNWRNLNDAQVILHNFWSDAHCPIESIDPESLIVTLETPSWRKFTDDNTDLGARYFIDNVFEAMDEAGEWYLDRPTGKLYYLAKPDEDMTTAEVIAPELDQMILFRGDAAAQEYVENITISGLTFAHSDWHLPSGDAGDHQASDSVPGAIEFIGARNITIENCRFEHLGTYGMEILDGCRDIKIQKNYVKDLGGGGIKISGGRAGTDSLLKTSHITFSDNSLEEMGRLYKASVGVLLRHASDNVISHNLVKDLYYTGISVGWEWGYKPSASYNNLVEYNHVENVGQGLLSDMGGIYLLGISPGTIVRNNLVTNVYSHGYGGWGIYTDEGSSDILIENNIVYDTKSAGFHQHYGRNNTIRNNIFAYGKIAQLMRSRNEEHLSFTFERNIVYWKDSELLEKRWDGDTTRFYFKNNLYYRYDDQPIRFMKYSVEKWREQGQDASSLFADPLFVDPENGDFDLKDGSPAFDIGFEPIDRTSIGPRLWPDEVLKIDYFSNADSTQQPAMYYNSGSEKKKPLLVGLHTWSGSYKQTDSLPYYRWCQSKDWVFIHPNFRGPNKTPQATGSDLVIDDILSAVEYAKQNANVDTNRIYLVGVSGGGYTTLQAIAKLPDVWAAASAWASISDLTAWHAECTAFGNRYAKMVELSCGGAPGESDSVDAQYLHRSPVNFLLNATSVPVDINAGIHDGFSGSVPVSHSINAFNVLAQDADKISDSAIEHIIGNKLIPEEMETNVADLYYGPKKPLLRRESNNARLTIFEGGHEIIPHAALYWLQQHSKK